MRCSNHFMVQAYRLSNHLYYIILHYSATIVLFSNHCHSIIYWWISKSNSSKESCCEVEYEAYDKIHMWRISIVFLHILIFYLIISNQRHSIIYWWISKSNSSKESCCEVEYEVYDKIHMWRISIVFLHILIFYLMNL